MSRRFPRLQTLHGLACGRCRGGRLHVQGRLNAPPSAVQRTAARTSLRADGARHLDREVSKRRAGARRPASWRHRAALHAQRGTCARVQLVFEPRALLVGGCARVARRGQQRTSVREALRVRGLGPTLLLSRGCLGQPQLRLGSLHLQVQRGHSLLQGVAPRSGVLACSCDFVRLALRSGEPAKMLHIRRRTWKRSRGPRHGSHT